MFYKPFTYSSVLLEEFLLRLSFWNPMPGLGNPDSPRENRL
jgi:hypothetical protein